MPDSQPQPALSDQGLRVLLLCHLCMESHTLTVTLSELTKENRIYIRVEFTRKKCKTVILLYCFHTADVIHIFVLYNLLGPGISFYRKF